jgi:hypothetical protein
MQLSSLFPKVFLLPSQSIFIVSNSLSQYDWLFFIVYSFIHMYIHCLGHLSPLPPAPIPLPPTPLPPGRICSALLFSNFVEEKTWDNMKDIAFLLAWDKDSYTEILIIASMHRCITTCTGSSLSLLSCHLPIVTSASIRLPYSLLWSENINLFQVLGFLSFPYSSCSYCKSHTYKLKLSIYSRKKTCAVTSTVQISVNSSI